MISTLSLDRFVRDLQKAARETPKAYKRMQQSVATRHLELLAEHAPPDVEGRLRGSLKKRPYKGQREWVERIRKDEMEVGTSVYYSPMVNDGHIVGTRLDNRGHRKVDWEVRRAAAQKAGRVWVSGTFFREQAEDQIEEEMDAFAQEFTEDALREVMR